MSTPTFPAQNEPQPIPAAYMAPPAAPVPASAPLASHNVFALLSIITVCMSPLLGLILGHIGLSKIKRTREAGRGLALTAVIIGYVAIAAVFLYFAIFAVWFGVIISAFGHYSSLSSYNY